MRFSMVVIMFSLLVSPLLGQEGLLNQLSSISVVSHLSPPYSDDSLEQGGLLTAIVREALLRAGYSADISFLPWVRAFNAAGQGRYDALFGVWYREERERAFYYSDPLIPNELIIVSHASVPLDFSGDLDTLLAYKIGYIRSYALPAQLLGYKDRLDIELVNRNIQNMRKLAAHRLDMIIIDKRLFYFLEKKHFTASEAFRPSDYVLQRDMNYLCFSRRDPLYREKAEAFNTALREMRRDGTFDSILSQFNNSVR